MCFFLMTFLFYQWLDAKWCFATVPPPVPRMSIPKGEVPTNIGPVKK